ncbi:MULTISPECIES: sugar ABC transporter ATP-binding protein [Paenibacillus]|uniref:sugar ABC transporter ATP-binding protein n=1 Tax=Paenibacillus TaxID=44249 RepID=UPI000BBD8F9C|nr:MULTISPECIES: sugar ABC transporter ATP-binding protein [Paenibacillus]PCL93736.1 D-xylose ABC transporter ATP-binding protein [Paenibacillus lautus]QOT11656.1 sugar ABC transporter ATP-binding protein [Paenibacillus sp. JNUCC-32]WFB56263.1 sugar ABC transporter ATP-binding protein [Paenibacillus sp. BR1-192]GIP03882.1 monosaccharide-transporting ATPase [Paenibacillus lautus]
MSEWLIQMEGIMKEFPGVLALNNCRFDLRAGEVHALMGENGAGKSTLMKILTGVYQKDAGTIEFKGQPVELSNPKAAQDAGISMIHQELNLAPDLTVAQNIFIGREPRRKLRLFLDDRALHRQVKELFERMGLDMDPSIKVSELTVAKQQMVEIAKALSYNADVLVMDEPTAALSETEIEDLFRIIRQLRESGVGIVYISHRMDEIKRITDRITVMRDGQYIDTVSTAEVTTQDIISKMVGRQIYETSKPERTAGERETVLEVIGLNQGRNLKNINLTLKKGEILGIAGLVGAGRTELARAIFGADRIQSGEIRVHGRKVTIKGPHDAVRQGIGYLSEDRKRYGCVVDLDVKSNVAIASYGSFLRPGGWMNTAKIREQAEDMVSRLKVKTPHVDQEVKFLSGGNQQKVVIGKWLTRDCDILIFDEPTRGIDVGAKSEIYRLLNDLAAQGKSIIMISSELPEILRMSHRILVMCEGRITGELDHEEATQESIMHLATARM